MMPPEELRQALLEAGEDEQLGRAETGIATTICRSCGRVHAPARQLHCLRCGGRDLMPGRSALRGTLESFTELRAGKVRPAGLALVRLDDGPLLTVELALGGAPPEVGARVAGVLVRGERAGEPRVRFRFAVVA